MTSNLEHELGSALEIIKSYKNYGKNAKAPDIERFSPAVKARELIAIDGSHSFIYNASSAWIAIIRAAALRYSCEGGYKLKDSAILERAAVISTHPEFIKAQPAHYRRISQEARGSPQKIADEMRRLCEYELLHRVAGEVSNCVIAMDGALTSPFLDEFKKKMEETLKFCTEKNNVLLGVSKDSHTHAFGSHLTDEELLGSVAEEGLFYAKVPEDFKKGYTPPLYGEVCFAKLFPKSPKWFRVDIAGAELEEALRQLVHYTRSELCPGYVYPLLEAHRCAVMVRHFKKTYEDSLLKLAPKYGFSTEDIISARTNIDGRSMRAFHEFLDVVARE